MAGPGAPAKDPSQRRRRNKPARGEWKATPGVGWQHGPIPDPPDGLMPSSVEAWNLWFSSWYAANWDSTALASLRQGIKLFDQVERGDYVRMTEVRLFQDTWGISPKGQQDRRWKKPEADTEPAQQATGTGGAARRFTVVEGS